MIMQRVVKRVLGVMALAMGIMIFASADAQAKTVTKNMTLNLNGNKVQYKRPSGLNKARKVRVTSSKKSIVSVKYKKDRKDRRIAFTLKKKGNAMVTVQCIMKSGQNKTIRYKVKVVKKQMMTVLERGKKAFSIQNQYRKSSGRKSLIWSDELYRFAMYRIKHSGYDKHENLIPDTRAYFGEYALYQTLMFGENMLMGSNSPDAAMKRWKGSKGHYKNLMGVQYQSGAIAYHKGMWIAVFSKESAKEIDSWKEKKLVGITVKRFDRTSGSYLTGSRVTYYDTNDKFGSKKSINITDSSGRTVYLEENHTYVFYESVVADGYKKAERVTLHVTKEGVHEIVLMSE